MTTESGFCPVCGTAGAEAGQKTCSGCGATAVPRPRRTAAAKPIVLLAGAVTILALVGGWGYTLGHSATGWPFSGGFLEVGVA
jgi:predicted nucleic acid-binding Zn ribbon protein